MLKALLIGESPRAEFCPALSWLDANSQLERVRDIAAAEERLAHALSSPQIVVLLHARPGLFSDADVTRLRRVSPLSRIVSLAGSWCEGQAHRNGAGLAGVQRVAWHEFAGRMQVEFERISARRSPGWALPLTAGVDELADFTAAQLLAAGAGLVVVDAPDEDSAAAVADMVALGGYSAVWLGNSPISQIRGAAAAVLCGAGWGGQAAFRLEKLQESHPAAPVIVLLDFPREQDVTAALAAGAAAVLAKPFTMSEFLGQLRDAHRTVGQAGSATRRLA